MSSPNPTASRAALEHEIGKFITAELMAPGETPSIAAEDDLTKRGILDSLGITQLVEFCESRYGIRVTDADLVPENFQSVRALAEYVDRKRGEQGNGLRSATRSG
jgi:acyl carrier protein